MLVNQIDLKLNTGQQEALEKMKDFIRRCESNNIGEYPFFTLEGAAGTGKTFTIKYLVKWYQDRWKRESKDKKKKPQIITAAFTHQAVRVIANSMQDKLIGVEYMTLNRLLGLASAFDGGVEQQVTYARRKEPPICSVDLLLIDERSMINSECWTHITNRLKGKRIPCILLGDVAQLPPVKEKVSLSYQIDIPEHHRHELTEVMRTGLDNPVIDWITKSRILTDINHPAYDDIATDICYLENQFSNDKKRGLFVVRSQEKLDKILEQSFCSDAFKEDSSYCRVLAYTNDTVNLMNIQIRTYLYGKESIFSPFIVGERLRATSAIFDDWGSNIIMDNSTQMEVIEVKHLNKPFPHWLLSVRDDSNQLHKFRTLCQNRAGQEAYIREYQVIRNKCHLRLNNKEKYPWKELNEFRNMWSNKVSYLYAQTVHLSQGSSINNVIVILNDLLIARKQDPIFFGQLVYTAFSRCKERLFVVR